MNYVTLGRTGLRCAAVSFGGIPIQRADAANTAAVVDALERHGMNYIDTARAYTVSEEYLGAALEGRRGQIYPGLQVHGPQPEGMARDIDLSLKNLRTGRIEVYQIHNLPLKDFDRVFGPAEPMRPWRRPGGGEGWGTSAPPSTVRTPCKRRWRSTPARSRR